MQHINHLNGILPTEHIPLHAVDVKSRSIFYSYLQARTSFSRWLPLPEPDSFKRFFLLKREFFFPTVAKGLFIGGRLNVGVFSVLL